MAARLLAALASIAVLGAGTASAQVGATFCDGLKQVVSQIPENFIALRGAQMPRSGPDDPLTDAAYKSGLTLDGAATCQISVGRDVGGFAPSTFLCLWSGSAPSLARANAIYGAMQACLGGESTDDLPVMAIDASPDSADASIVRPGLLAMLLATPKMATLTVSSQTNPMAMVRLHMRQP